MADLHWAKEQLAKMNISDTSTGEPLLVYQTVMQLLGVFNQQNHTESSKTQTLDLFNDLARNHVLIPDDDPDMWVPLQAGFFRKGDQVRVKKDAFSDHRGPIHNGRRGVIVDARRGDVIVDIRDGATPDIQGYHYRPEELEGLMR